MSQENTGAAEAIAAAEKRARETASAESKKRVSEIVSIGKQFASRGGNEWAAEALQNEQSVDEFRASVMDKIAKLPVPTSDIGLSEKEARQFSFIRAIHALSNPGDRKAQEQAAFEREASDAVGAKLGKNARGFYIPSDVQKIGRAHV